MKSLLAFLLLSSPIAMMGQPAQETQARGGALGQSSAPAPVTMTAARDQQNMMDQLGIVALRPGPSGSETAPNHANYDEAKANPLPQCP